MSTVNVSTRDLFSSPVVTKVIRTIANPQTYFQDFFNLGPDSSIVEDISGHDASYDVFENTRQLANMRAYGTGPGTRKPQISGHVFARIPRMHEKVMLYDEMIFRNRRLGGSVGDVDKGGQQYVYNQQRIISQRFRNTREFMISRMLRGGFGVLNTGEDWIPVETGSGTMDVDYKIPAANLTTLNMLGEGAIISTLWSTLTADIPAQCASINRAFAQLHGRPLRHVFIDTPTFQTYVMNNTKVQAAAGTANKVWQSWERSTRPGAAPGHSDAGFEVVLAAIPWLTWHLYDGVLEVNGTTTQTVPTGHAIFLPDPDASWVGGMQGSEMVREDKVSASVERFGMQAWTELSTQPSGFELLAVDNFLPIPYVPTCIANATVI